ncbi:MAG: FISUMP domain-containing protein [Candidatus Falkowbacteria bacterium]
MKLKKAFTLIELLVVIAIIGILATISVLALSNARAKSRDAKRAGDMKQVQTALELFFNDKNRYPTIEEWNTGKIYSTTTDATSTYMQVIPTAPTPADGNCGYKNTISYIPSTDGSTYSISFCLGNTTGSLTPGPKCLTPGGIVDVDCFVGDNFSCVGVPVVQSEGGLYDANGVSTTTGGYYRTVDINGQCWLRDNLNIGTLTPSISDQSNNSVVEKYCYGDSAGNCLVYGGLYQWAEAMQLPSSCNIVNCTALPSDPCCDLATQHQGICPLGWHLPTDLEQYTLENYLTDSPSCNANRIGVGDCANAGSKLQVGGTSHFEVLLAGYRDWSGSFYHQGGSSNIWSSTTSGSSSWYRFLYINIASVDRSRSDRTYGFSVRCLQD